jgi:hypothetical protein
LMSRNCSPASKFDRTYRTQRSTHGLSGSSEMSVQRWLADIRGLGRVVELRWGLGRDTSVSVRHANYGRVVFNQDLGKLAAPRSATTRRRTGMCCGG